MNIILDTHAFIWLCEDSPLLSEKAKGFIEDEKNNIFISIVSFWEIAIKISIKKLEISIPYDELLKKTIENGIEILPILFEHTSKIGKLSFFHRDPFDRMIISQTLVDNLFIISNDEVFDKYDAKRIW